MSVVLVDWLGRGGIAQTTEAWALELGRSGTTVSVVTRPDRELGSGAVPVIAAEARQGRIAAHRAVARAAASLIVETAPSVVVVQNYLLPAFERPVYAAAREIGARVVVVVHDHRLHSRVAGTRSGLRRELQRADAVVAHTHFVADGVTRWAGRKDIIVLPHPAQVGMLEHEAEAPDLGFPGGELVAGHFGVLQRGYKGGSTVEALASCGLEGWSFLAMGRGAPEGAIGLQPFPGYASPGLLCGTMGATDAVLAPYRFATQSGIVVLAHLLGAVPVASAVGGIPEQIEDGIDGILVPPAAPIEIWREALDRLRDEDHRKQSIAAGKARAWREHAEFSTAIRELVA